MALSQAGLVPTTIDWGLCAKVGERDTGRVRSRRPKEWSSSPRRRCATRPSRSYRRSERILPVARRSLDLAVELYARGLSTRDIEDAFRDESRRLLSRAAMSEITERLWAEYEALARLALTYKSDRLRPEDLLAALAYSGKGTIRSVSYCSSSVCGSRRLGRATVKNDGCKHGAAS